MAEKRLLHIKKLSKFKNWLLSEGWRIEEPKNIYEVLRAKKEGRGVPLLVFAKKGNNHFLIVADRGNKTIDAFINSQKINKKGRGN